MDRFYRVEYRERRNYALEREGEWHLLHGSPFGDYTTAESVSADDVRLLAPVLPSKIVAIGLNYRDHAQEMNKPLPTEPLIFLKPSSAVVGPGDAIVIPGGAGRVDHEAELGVVIGRTARHVPAARAHEYLFGLTCVNDVTARRFQSLDVQYTRAKGFDTFAPVGPSVVVGLNGASLAIEGWVNGKRRQTSNTRQLIFSIERLVEFVSGVMTLFPGDVIATGTPSGVGPIVPGDQVVIKVEGIGELANEVVGAGEPVARPAN